MAVNKWSLTSLCFHCLMASHRTALAGLEPTSTCLPRTVVEGVRHHTQILQALGGFCDVASVGLYGHCVLNGSFPRFFGHKAQGYPKISLRSVGAGAQCPQGLSDKRCLDRRCSGLWAPLALFNRNYQTGWLFQDLLTCVHCS